MTNIPNNIVSNNSLENDTTTQTSRKTVPEMEKILGKELPVLDKGFVRLIDYMGNDEAIVQAARVSYGKGTKAVNQDEGLIRYLLRHRHTTPFEMCEIKLHIKVPIFIARQWIRHRTANVNEISARYSVLNEEFYLPDLDQICKQSKSNKQGRADKLDENIANHIQEKMGEICTEAFDKYSHFMEEHNLTRELARIILPLASYTEFYWKIDLHNLLHFLCLRAAPGAQKEIREYANKMLEIVKAWVPLTYQAFMDYRMNNVEFSGNELSKLLGLINNEKAFALIESSSDAKGEAKEFIEKIKLLMTQSS